MALTGTANRWGWTAYFTPARPECGGAIGSSDSAALASGRCHLRGPCRESATLQPFRKLALATVARKEPAGGWDRDSAALKYLMQFQK
jgi:hypothetical protein